MIATTQDPAAGRLVRRLPRRSSVRRVADRILAGEEPPGAVDTLIAALDDAQERRWREREAAAWLLGCIVIPTGRHSEVVRALSDALNGVRETRRSRWPVRAFNACWRTVALVALAAALYAVGVHISEVNCELDDRCRTSYDLLNLILILCTFVAGSLAISAPVMSLALDSDRGDRVRASAATTLGALALPETVDALARGWRRRSARSSRACLDALMCVLPNLRPDQYGTLNGLTVPTLSQVLLRSAWSGDWAQQSIALDALAVVGDGRACEFVEQYLDVWLPATMREKARHTLLILQERRERERAQQVLLRASDAPADSDSLLRPAAAAAANDQAVLLRPIGVEDTLP